MALFVEDEDCRGKDGEEEEYENYGGALGTDLLDGHGGGLEGCEGRGLLLNLCLCQLQLGRHLRVCTKLQLHLVLELGLLALLPCEDGMPVGVGIGGTPEAGLFITGLGFLEEFLIVGQVDTSLAGTVVGDEILNWETALPTQNLGEPIL